MANIPEEALLALAVKNKGGGGGTSNYEDLENKPKIAGTTLSGNKSLADLGIASAQSVSNITNGENINNFAGVETALDGKQATLTFDNVPTENSTNPVKSGGVYSALSAKQNALTAGNYIAIENDGTIKVTQGIGVYDVYSYKIEGRISGTNYWTNVIKYKNGIQQSSNTYYAMEAMTPINIDDRLTLKYVRDGVSWHVTLLVDSNEHQAGEDITWKYNVNKDFTETFNVSKDSSTDLATKGDIDAAISSAYHHAGTKTCAELVAGLLVAANEGNVYNMTDSGTTTADFIEGAGQPIKAGDNVGVAKVSDGVYKFDLLSGFVDTTNFVQKSQTAGLLKNDGTVDTTIQGDIASLKSGLTNLSEEVNGDATVYPYADVITIEDAVPANLANCSVKIEPVQDLHGYDKPWVGGAGKNKLPITVDGIKAANIYGTWSGNTYTLNGVSFEMLTDDSEVNVHGFKISGTATSNLFLYTSVSSFDGSYILNGCPQGGSGESYFVALTGTSSFYDTGNGASVNVSNSSLRMEIGVASGYSFTNALTFYPMLRLATETDAAFAPYTNICPISGHTEASVKTEGKNLFDKSNTTSGYINGNNGEASDSSPNWEKSEKIYVHPNTQYIISVDSAMSSSTAGLAFYDKDDNYISGIVYSSVGWLLENSRYYQTLTSPSNAAYAKLTCKLNDENRLMFARGTVTAYTPYVAPHTYTIALGDTIYGGKVRIDSNGNTVMDVDRVVVDLGTQTWHYSSTNTHFYTDEIANAKTGTVVDDLLCSCYEIDNRSYSQYSEPHLRYLKDLRIYIIDANYTDPTVFASAVNGQTVVYPLATTTIIQLTTQQIQLLKGQNTLTASTGQISVTANGVSGSIGSVQEQVNDLQGQIDEIELPSNPSADGSNLLRATTVSGETTKSWVSESLFLATVGGKLVDCNTETSNGIIRVLANSTNMPSGAGDGVLIVFRPATDNVCVQMFIESGGKISERINWYGTWSTWKTMAS